MRKCASDEYTEPYSRSSSASTKIGKAVSYKEIRQGKLVFMGGVPPVMTTARLRI